MKDEHRVMATLITATFTALVWFSGVVGSHTLLTHLNGILSLVNLSLAYIFISSMGKPVTVDDDFPDND